MRKLFTCFLFLWVAMIANAQYVINGTAENLGGNEFRLTHETTDQGGSVWYQVRLDLRYNFVINADLNLGRLDGGGADGVAFVLQPLSSGIGGQGGGIGYFGIHPSLAVEFDTWQNTDRFDPPQDHLAFMQNGDVTHSGANAGYYTLPNIEDNLYHSAIFAWDASTHTMTVNYLGNTFIYSNDIIANIFAGNPYVYWGFTGATGAAINDQRVNIGTTSFIEEMHVNGVATNTSCGLTNGAVDITATGGVAPYSYLWSNGATTEDLSNLTAGTYRLTVTDAEGVSTDGIFEVGNTTDNISPVITCSATPVNLCFSNTGNYNIPVPDASDACGITEVSYSITGATIRTGNSMDASGAFNPGTSMIRWTVKDASGNTNSCSTTVVVNASLTGGIPNVFAVNPGGLANTIYIGYGPSSLPLTVVPTGGTAPYHFVWSTGATSTSINVTPGTVGNHTYSVVITDGSGCTTVASTIITVKDIRCGNKMEKVIVCHIPPGNPGNAHEICISPNAVPAHLAEHGDMLGACIMEIHEVAKVKNFTPEETTDITTVQPNPSRGQFELKLPGSGKAEIAVYNSNGRLVQKKTVQLNGKIPVQFDLNKEAAGVYLIEVNVNGKIETQRIVIQR
jgi:hypothetical protein